METKEYTLTKEEYLKNKKTIKKYLEKKIPGHSWNHLLWLIISDKDVLKCWKPLQTEKRIQGYAAQGRNKYWKLQKAITELSNALFYSKDNKYNYYLLTNKIVYNSTEKYDDIYGTFYAAKPTRFPEFIITLRPEVKEKVNQKLKELKQLIK